MKINAAALPRQLLWTAAGLAAVALLTIVVCQVLTVVMTSRPATLTRWLNGLYVISSQAILASIALAVSGFALHVTQKERAPLRAIASAPAAPMAPVRPMPIPAPAPPEENLPRELRSAVASAATPQNRK